jgi:hypothetical protein
MRFGWSSIQDDYVLFSQTNVEPEETPFLYITGKQGESPCTVLSKRKFDDPSHLAIIEDVIVGRSCTNATTVKALPIPETETVEFVRPGVWFVCFAIGCIGLGVVSFGRAVVGGGNAKIE